MSEIKINSKILLDNELTLDQYFIMYCVYNKDSSLLGSYINKCTSIDFDVFDKLAALEYIDLGGVTDEVRFSQITLTDKGMCLFGASKRNPSLIGQSFDEFKDNYPSSVREGRKVRRLHGNIKKCRELYLKLLNEVPHDVLCKCARLYHKEMRQSGSEIYMQMLETWLNQRNYQQYLDEAQNSSDEISQEGGFTYDL